MRFPPTTTILIALLYTLQAECLDNGLGLLPPMGWRSWNSFGKDVTMFKMEAVIDAMVDKHFEVNGVPTSLSDLGYNRVGIDDNWQQCGGGVNGSFHDINGVPLINKTAFPDLKELVEYGQTNNLKMGWYANNCICRESQFQDEAYIAKHMEQTVRSAVNYGFDGIKLDGCGQFLNLSWWSELINKTHHPILIENCHWGRTIPGKADNKTNFCNGNHGVSDCPYNFYRTSYDIYPYWENVIINLNTMIPFLGEPPLSRPGGWAYLDMLEVGNLASFEEDRSHFGAWVVTSSPLILGHDVTNYTITKKIWDIIANKELIEVSQSWEGHPGRRVSIFDPPGERKNQTAIQIWAKRVGGQKEAVFIMSDADTKSHSVNISLSSVGFGVRDVVSVRDLYNHVDLGSVTGRFETDSIKPHDSRFYIFEKKK